MEEGKEMSLKKQAQGMKEEEQAMLPLPLGAWRELLRKSTLERGQGPGILPVCNPQRWQFHPQEDRAAANEETSQLSGEKSVSRYGMASELNNTRISLGGP